MYPEVRALLPDLEDDVLESYEEHHVADILCMELSGMARDAERFDAKTTVLIESVTHHIKEEEEDWFPKVRAGLSRKQLQEIGARIEEARDKAPRTPVQPSALKKTVDAIISWPLPAAGSDTARFPPLRTSRTHGKSPALASREWRTFLARAELIPAAPPARAWANAAQNAARSRRARRAA
jgi:hypothetical protein